MPFMVGQTVGDYVVVRAAGAGSLSSTYLVEHTITRRLETMKVLGGSVGDRGICTPQESSQFFAGIVRQASLSHPNIANVHNAFWVDDRLVMICEHVEGEPLERALENGAPALEQTLHIMSGILSALRYAHAHGVFHGALAADKILLAPDGNAKLLDFRLSPGASAREDIDACGVLFHELVTGSKPVPSRVAPHFLEQRCEEALLRSGGGRELAVPLRETISRSISSEASDRFPSAREFHDAVHSLARALETGPSRRVSPAVYRALAGVGALGLAFGMLMLVSAMRAGKTADPAPKSAVQSLDPSHFTLSAPAASVPAAPLAPPVAAAPAEPPPAPPQPPRPSKPAPQRVQSASTVPARKHPIRRFAGAIKKLNPMSLRGDHPSAESTGAQD